MKSLLIGLLIAAVGYLTQSLLLMVLGILLGVLGLFLEKPEQVNYKYVENKPKIIVVNSKPPKEKIPLPFEEPSPLGRAIHDKELKPLEDKLKKLTVDYFASTGEAKKKIEENYLKTKEEYLDKKSKLSVLPFGVKKEESNPLSGLFKGIGINWSLKMLAHIFNKKK